MDKAIQALPWLYEKLSDAGVTRQAWFKHIYDVLYFAYKRHLEDPFEHLARRHPELFRNGAILDVGANVGYTTSVFARVLTPGHRLYAFEPESDNFASLCRRIDRLQSAPRCEAIPAAVGERSEKTWLWINERSRGDHRIATRPLRSRVSEQSLREVPMLSLDDFLGERGDPPVSFIKVDAQGSELQVCRGMSRALTHQPRLTLAIEYAPAVLQDLGTDPSDLLAFLSGHGLTRYLLSRTGEFKQVGLSEIQAQVDKRGYVDLVFRRGS